MPDIGDIQAKIDYGRGRAAEFIGQSYDVYRLNASSTGSLIQMSNRVFSYFKMQIKRDESKENTESNVIIKVPRFRAICNGGLLQIGDVLVERGSLTRPDETKPYSGNMFTFAYFRPIRRYIMMQTPISGQISRANNDPASTNSGRVAYGTMAKPLEQVLTLVNGLYAWSSTGAPAGIPIGLIATSKAGSLPPPDRRLPTDVPRQSWDVYCPALPGVALVESHIITAANGDRYFVRTPFIQYIGLQGWQMNCEKLRV